ncbi:hypothetical protein TNCV_4802021 [Trichonephila clavipes]|nr:hypothetical protein TNCV_4802021 [Trichonephila clavipes]
MIAASPLSPDEYAMRIATQTESALICKEYSSPFIVSPIPVFPAPQRTPSPMSVCRSVCLFRLISETAGPILTEVSLTDS